MAPIFRDDFTGSINGAWTETDTAGLISVLNNRAFFENGGAANFTDHHLTHGPHNRSDVGAFCALVRLTNTNAANGGAAVILGPSSSDPSAAGGGGLSTNAAGAGNYQLFGGGVVSNVKSSRSIDYLYSVVKREGGGFFTLVSGGEFAAYPSATLVGVTATETGTPLYAHLATRQARAHFDYAAVLPNASRPTGMGTRYGAAAWADTFDRGSLGNTAEFGGQTYTKFGTPVITGNRLDTTASFDGVMADPGVAVRVIRATIVTTGSANAVSIIFRGDGTLNSGLAFYADDSISGLFNQNGGGALVQTGAFNLAPNSTHEMYIVDTGSTVRVILDGNEQSFTTSLHAGQRQVGVALETGTLCEEISVWPATVTLHEDFGNPPSVPNITGAPTVTDTFNAANGTALPTHNADWQTHSGTWEINTNRGRMTTAGVNGVATRTAPGADQSVQCIVNVPADVSAYPTDVFCGVFARRSAADTYLFARYLHQDGPSPEIELMENNAGVQELIGYVNLTGDLVAGDHTIKLAVRGSEAAAYHNGELVVQATTAVAATGRAGIGVSDTLPAGQPTWEDLAIGATVGAQIPAGPLRTRGYPLLLGTG